MGTLAVPMVSSRISASVRCFVRTRMMAADFLVEVGVVDSDSDKSVVTMRAREVPGTFAVDNHLMIDTRKSKP